MSQSTQSIPLIDGPDNWEIIRDKIGEILATENAAQIVLATAEYGAAAAEAWRFSTYLERSNPWEAFKSTTTPIVNVWVDRSQPDLGSSNRSTRQKHTTRYNIDIYAYAKTEETAGGQTPGDKGAALVAHRVIRLLRNILMHDKYTYLALRPNVDTNGCVWGRWLSDFEIFQPVDGGGRPVQRVVGARLHLDVEHNEIIDLAAQETLEIISVEIQRGEDDMVIAELEYDHSGT
jgi:hypothetical protein